MAEFNALGLVDLGDTQSQHGKPEKQITLKDEFQWFLSDEFNNVRKNTPVCLSLSSDNDEFNTNTVREHVNSNSKNENENESDLDNNSNNNKEAHRGDFPYIIIERLPPYYSRVLSCQGHRKSN